MGDLNLERISQKSRPQKSPSAKNQLWQAEKGLTVALLFEDVVRAREVAKVFRKVGIVPHVYQDLKTYWEEVYELRPSLSVVDIKKMSDGKLLLKDHPLVRAELPGQDILENQENSWDHLHLSIYYENESIPLLQSTYEIQHLGLICGDMNIRGQIKSVLRRFNQFKLLEGKLQKQVNEEKRLEGNITSLLKQVEQLKERDYYARLTESIIDRFENLLHLENFEDVVERVFVSLKEVHSFAIYELSKSGQKLISPELSSPKAHSLPPIWLGSRSQKGIQNYAQNMAQQVGAEILGGELMALSICGGENTPEQLLLLKVGEEEMMNYLHWDELERYLSGLYSRFLLRERAHSPEEGETEVSPWEMLSLLDRIEYDGRNVFINSETDLDSLQQGLSDERYGLISLSFSDLLSFLKSRQGKARFYWKEFYREFFRRFDFLYKAHYRMSCFGVGECFLLVNKSEADKIFSQLKAFVGRYPLWRYFEDTDVVLTQDLTPEIKMLPVSSLSVVHRLLRERVAEFPEVSNETISEPNFQKSESKGKANVSEEMEMILADQMNQALKSQGAEELSEQKAESNQSNRSVSPKKGTPRRRTSGLQLERR